MPRKKQRRAWGSVTEIKRGKKYVLRWPDPSKRCGRATETFYGTYREACERLDVIHAERLKDSAPHSRMTIGEIYSGHVLPEYRRRIELGQLKSKSLECYEYSWGKTIKQRWADVGIADVTHIDVQEWLMTMPLGHAKQSMIVMKKIGDFAEANELVQRNVFRSDYLMPAAGVKRSRGICDNAELDEILSLVKGSRIEPAFILAAYGSCRSGESLGVRCSEVEPFEHDGQTFAIVPIVRRMRGSGTEPTKNGDLKTAESKRAVVVPPPYGQRLLDIAAGKTREGIEWLADRGDGLPLNRSAANREWGKLVPDEKRIPFQNLRTSWRTMAAMEWGVSSDVLEMLMGHRLPGTTGHHYMRPSWEQLAERFALEFAKNRTS